MSKREAAVDAIVATCDLVPRLNGMKFSDAPDDDHRAINRVHVGVVHGALGRDLHEWRPPQVADFVRIKGSGRYGPDQTEAHAITDLRRAPDELEARFPGLRASVRPESRDARPTMPAFRVDQNARIVRSLNATHKAVRGEDQPTGPITPPGFYGTDAGHFYAELAMEGVVCGPGGRYNTMPDERVDIADFLDMVRIYMMVIADICEVA
jgi:acetylornithine deacetylase